MYICWPNVWKHLLGPEPFLRMSILSSHLLARQSWFEWWFIFWAGSLTIPNHRNTTNTSLMMFPWFGVVSQKSSWYEQKKLKYVTNLDLVSNGFSSQKKKPGKNVLSSIHTGRLDTGWHSTHGKSGVKASWMEKVGGLWCYDASSQWRWLWRHHPNGLSKV